jgi:putative oxidoreductase
MLNKLQHLHQCFFYNGLSKVNSLPLLALRIYLFFPFWMAGSSKIDFDTFLANENTVYWFGEVLNMPLPSLMAFLAGWTELLGALFLLVGIATRYITIPLIITMLVAIFAVHFDNGWAAIASSSADPEVAKRLTAARDILSEYGHYDWLTEKGNFVILNNGIEFGVTYLLMLLVLLFQGAGNYVSADYWVKTYLNLQQK